MKTIEINTGKGEDFKLSQLSFTQHSLPFSTSPLPPLVPFPIHSLGFLRLVTLYILAFTPLWLSLSPSVCMSVSIHTGIHHTHSPDTLHTHAIIPSVLITINFTFVTSISEILCVFRSGKESVTFTCSCISIIALLFLLVKM